MEESKNWDVKVTKDYVTISSKDRSARGFRAVTLPIEEAQQVLRDLISGMHARAAAEEKAFTYEPKKEPAPMVITETPLA